MKCLNITAWRGFSALHACEPIAGLRSSGKGANRTILDCLFRRIGREKRSFCRRGGRGRRQPPPGAFSAFPGAVPPAADEKGLGIVTTASSADHPTRRDFLFVATGAAAAVGTAVTAWPFISQMNPDASTIAAGAPIDVDLAPIAGGTGHQGVLARQADLHQPPHQEADRRGPQGAGREPARSAVRPGAGQGGPRPVAGRDRHLHPSRLHPDRP